MEIQRAHVRFMGRVVVIGALAVVMTLACSSGWAEGAAASTPADAALIERLEAAKTADWNGARDPKVSPIRQGTFLNQMNKATRAIDELEHGQTPPAAEINDALWSPPDQITPQERAQLLAQLKQARAQDDHNEQEMLNALDWSRSAAPADTETFDARKQEIDRVIENLEIGAPVRWSAIHRALQVPAPN